MNFVNSIVQSLTMEHQNKRAVRKLRQGSPLTTVKEFENTLHRRPELQEFLIKTEMAYYVMTHKLKKLTRPDLFRQNGIQSST